MTTTYRATFQDVADVLRELDYSAEVVTDDAGADVGVVVHCLTPSMRAEDAPVLAAMYRNAEPVEGDGPARWGVQIDYPDHESTYGDDDPTLGEGWALPDAATEDASADRLAAVLLGYAAEREARPTTKARWAEIRGLRA